MQSFFDWQTHIRAGVEAIREGKLELAQTALREAMVEAEELDSLTCIAFTQRLLATLLVKTDRLVEAEKEFQQSLTNSLKLRNIKGYVESLAGLASIKAFQNKLDEALELYALAVTIYPDSSSPLRLAALHTEHAQICIRKADWRQSQFSLQKAGRLYQENKYLPGEGEVSFTLGEVCYLCGDNRAARRYFLKAAKIFALLNDIASLAATHHLLAFFHMEQRQLVEALFYEGRAAVLLLQASETGIDSLARRDLVISRYEANYLQGHIWWQLGFNDEAEKYFLLAVHPDKGKSNLDWNPRRASIFQTLALTATQRCNYTAAKDYYFQAMQLYQYAGDGPKVGEMAEELTFLIRYSDQLPSRRFYEEQVRWQNFYTLALHFEYKGQLVQALQFGWKALYMLKQETELENQDQKREKVGEIQNFVRAQSQAIRERRAAEKRRR